jgi:hypothetical protein
LEPLEIVFYLSTPVALGAPWLFFDSLLARIVLREQLGEKYYSLPTKIPLGGVPEIPLKKWRDLYVASVGIFEPSGVGMHIFSFFKRGDHPFPSGKISRGSGFFKDFYLKAVYIPAVKVRFYATGEIDEVRRLVSKVAALGKERNIGFGFVKKVEVKEVEHEWGLVKDGVAMRPIPVQYLKSYEDVAYMPYKPPYWDKKSIALCAPPFTRVVLL